jgi:hypothetical protein
MNETLQFPIYIGLTIILLSSIGITSIFIESKTNRLDINLT